MALLLCGVESSRLDPLEGGMILSKAERSWGNDLDCCWWCDCGGCSISVGEIAQLAESGDNCCLSESW